MLKWEGVSRLNARLKRALKEFPKARSQFLAQEAELLTGRVKKLTPADTGYLRGSWSRGEVEGDSVEVGNSADYAAHVEYGHRIVVFGKDTGRVRHGEFMLRDSLAESENQFANDAEKIMERLFR